MFQIDITLKIETLFKKRDRILLVPMFYSDKKHILNILEKTGEGDACHGDQWATIGCCYSDNGASCDADQLRQDASEVFTGWYDGGERACDDAATITANPDCASCEDKCQVKSEAPNDQICWNLKWYCHDPVAIGIYDIPHCDTWETAGCCYGGDNGLGCDTDLLRQDANTIYDQWVSAGHACDVNWGEMVEVQGYALYDF